MRAHALAKTVHVVKFVSFIKKNSDVPFLGKKNKKSVYAALMSVVLYGCESWLNADIKPIAKLYNWALKTLLHVWMTSRSDVCNIESENPPIHAVIKKSRESF